jgi:hypothetical protein
MRRLTKWFATGALLVANSTALACPMCGGASAGNDGRVAGFDTTSYVMIGGFVGCLLLVVHTIIKGIRGAGTRSMNSTRSERAIAQGRRDTAACGVADQ